MKTNAVKGTLIVGLIALSIENGRAAVVYEHIGPFFSSIVDSSAVPGTYDGTHRLTGRFTLNNALLSNMPFVGLGAPNFTGIVL